MEVKLCLYSFLDCFPLCMTDSPCRNLLGSSWLIQQQDFRLFVVSWEPSRALHLLPNLLLWPGRSTAESSLLLDEEGEGGAWAATGGASLGASDVLPSPEVAMMPLPLQVPSKVPFQIPSPVACYVQSCVRAWLAVMFACLCVDAHLACLLLLGWWLMLLVLYLKYAYSRWIFDLVDLLMAISTSADKLAKSDWFLRRRRRKRGLWRCVYVVAFRGVCTRDAFDLAGHGCGQREVYTYFAILDRLILFL
jgi:hypothetical protein